MSNLNRYDYETLDANVDKEALAAEKAKRIETKRRMLFVFKTVIAHIVALAAYLVVFSNTGDFESYYDESEERIVLTIFSAIAVAVFGALNSIELFRSSDKKEAFIKDRPFERKKNISLALGEVRTYTILYAIFQLPAAIYHLFAGFDYIETSIFEHFFVLDMGLMELCRFAPLGIVLNCIIFAAFLFLFRLNVCRRWQKDEESFERGEKMKRKYG